MKFKVDENLPREVCDLLSRAGHDAASVEEQALSGADDARIYERCQDEGRAFITLDVDFANVHAYQPRSSAGVVVLRLRRQDKLAALDAVARMLPLLQQEPLRRRLWIIEATRIRIRE